MLPRLHAAEGDAIVRACREEARRAATGAGGHATPSAVTVPAAGPAQVEAWLQEQQACTANEQHAFLRVVGDHVIASLRCKTDPVTRPKKPLRWLLHGRPGVGKSYTLLKVRELLTDVLGFTQGVEFQYTALQGIMAAQYDGVTLHTLLGLDKRQQAVDGARHERLTRTIQHLRWLVIDEASMLSAHFLAEVECKLRLLLPRQSCDPASEADEAFGGINIILAGDFHQLDPPDNGVALCTPPSSRPGDKKIARAATSEYGLALLWDKRPELGFHGASELTTPHRCTEPWWMEVLEECRFGKLSANNHAFLHGKHTTVVGSALQGRASCGNPNCERLSGEACARRECGVCRRERRRRHRVVSDPRQCQEGKFAEAPFICPNNDVRYEVNKRRAQAHAAKTRQRTMWCPAKDRPSLRVAVATQDMAAQKLKWLTVHDRKTAELPGMLPLVRGMPIRLTQKIDDAKGLLRGTVGRLVGWAAEPDTDEDVVSASGVLKTMPAVLLLQFPQAKWQVKGTSAPGTYALKPVTKSWYLDLQKKSRSSASLGNNFRSYRATP